MRRGRQIALAIALVVGGSSSARAAPPEGPAPKPAPAPERDPVAEGDVGFWRAHIGMDIDLVLDDQSRFAGHLLAIEAGQLIAARRSDGTIVVIPASRVMNLSAHRPRPQLIRPMTNDRGTGLIAAGATFVALGGLMFVGTLVERFACGRGASNSWPYTYGDCSKRYLGYLVPGLVFTAAGVPMIVAGKIRQHRFRRGQLTAGFRIDRTGMGLQIGGRF